MKVILLDKVPNVGNVGEMVNVSQGHARNYLLPNQLAVLADESNQKQLDHQQKRLQKSMAEEVAKAEDLKEKLDGMVIELVKKVGPNGRLFGSVTNSELSKELADRDFKVERRLISIENPIKSLGSFNIKVHLFEKVNASFEVKIVMDPAQVEELKLKEAAAKRKAEQRKDQKEAPADKDETKEVANTEPKSREDTLDEEANKILRS